MGRTRRGTRTTAGAEARRAATPRSWPRSARRSRTGSAARGCRLRAGSWESAPKSARPPAARPGGRGWAGPIRSAPLDDLDLVRHAGDAVHARDVVEREVALELEVDVALERDPAVVDVDVEVVARELGVPAQPLQGRAPHLGVLATVTVEDAHVQLVVHVDDAAGAPRAGDRRALLGEAADRPPQGHCVAEGLDGDLVGIREARITREFCSHVVDNAVVGEVHCGSPCPPPWVEARRCPRASGDGRADSRTVFGATRRA